MNECAEHGHECAFRCHNTLGSYRCVCPYGYELAPDGKHCRGKIPCLMLNHKTSLLYFIDVNECLTEANNCNFHCKNLIGTFICTCPEGFRKPGLEDDCVDVDECSESSDLCGDGRCINTVGGYQCECPPGYLASSDGRSCEDNRLGLCYQRAVRGRCEAGGRTPVKMTDCCCTMGVAWGDQCTLCPRRGSPQYRDLCREQGLGPLGRDIDECETMPDLCRNGICINTLGSFRCSCDRGYTPDMSRTSCEDVNECERVS